MRLRWAWIGMGVLAVGLSFLATTPHQEWEAVAAQVPELRLVSSGKLSGRPDIQDEYWLFSGPGDSDRVAARLQRLLRNRRGWFVPQAKPGSPFPYRNRYEPFFAVHPFRRLLSRWIPLRSEPPLDLRVIQGRAGAKPFGGPWTTLVITRTWEIQGFDTSEPIRGWGIQM